MFIACSLSSRIWIGLTFLFEKIQRNSLQQIKRIPT